MNLDNRRGELEKYLRKEQMNKLGQLTGKGEMSIEEGIKVDKRKFKGIWRNQKVIVKYRNGETNATNCK